MFYPHYEGRGPLSAMPAELAFLQLPCRQNAAPIPPAMGFVAEAAGTQDGLVGIQIHTVELRRDIALFLCFVHQNTPFSDFCQSPLRDMRLAMRGTIWR